MPKWFLMKNLINLDQIINNSSGTYISFYYYLAWTVVENIIISCTNTLNEVGLRWSGGNLDMKRIHFQSSLVVRIIYTEMA